MYTHTDTKSHFSHLGHSVEVDHSIREGLRVSPEVWYQSQHGSVEGAIDLLQRKSSWVVNVDDRDMAQEPRAQQTQ